MITKFTPSHDVSINSADAKGSVELGFSFSQEMDCDAVTRSISVSSTIEGGSGRAEIDESTINCAKLTDDEKPPYAGAIGSEWRWKEMLKNVEDGMHSVKVVNASIKAGNATGSSDRFLVRVGASDDPVAYPMTANYSGPLLIRSGDHLYVNHRAAGASSWRYTTN